MWARPATPLPLGLAAALVPVAALVGLLGLSFYLFGADRWGVSLDKMPRIRAIRDALDAIPA
jgi:hypothetical protein